MVGDSTRTRAGGDPGRRHHTVIGFTVTLPNRAVEARLATNRNDSNVVDIFDMDGHHIRCLEDVIGVVVIRAHRRNAMISKATIPIGAIQPRVGWM